LQAKSRCTGANRGLGAAIARTLLGAGAAVYRGARDPSTITDDRIIPFAST
jgi:NAD(P)-dependent dehydrogenase (short-subunit alcohol dehydrogenase family)